MVIKILLTGSTQGWMVEDTGVGALMNEVYVPQLQSYLSLWLIILLMYRVQSCIPSAKFFRQVEVTILLQEQWINAASAHPKWRLKPAMVDPRCNFIEVRSLFTEAQKRALLWMLTVIQQYNHKKV
ncbi:uncharacterized protein MCYG_01805 [Microsporum canis CBS 113480]|uniref:Uncharacterized protein n=1 Tax=Arthroderma otae (strain ATCC MYA-4605 / CBS 113480) TaxID=554155 RepID=C5FI06_ARTOC|nr:uncharacterized protein MCYG_01805 [Microsporum canis CBS 113480]EEQ28986.1 predicted protein [Microsporum canis CBS 113480]